MKTSSTLASLPCITVKWPIGCLCIKEKNLAVTIALLCIPLRPPPRL